MKTVTEVSRLRYGHDSRALNLHEDRTYRDAQGNLYLLSRTLDGVPPFFEAYGPFSTDAEGCIRRLRVNGDDYWGSGWTWARAIHAFLQEIGAVLTSGGI